MALPTVTLTGRVHLTDAEPTPKLVLYLLAPMLDAADEVIVPAQRIEIPVASDGTFSQAGIVPSDGAGLAPSPVAYKVIERFGEGRRYQVLIPGGSPSVDLSTLAPVGVAPTPPSAYALLSDLEAAIAGLDAAGAAAAALATAEAFATSAVTTEAGTRASADTALAGSVASEASTRAAADTTNAGAIAAEASTARAAESTKVAKTGDTMAGDLAMGGHRITGAADANTSTGLTTLQQVQALITALVNGAPGILDTLGEIATQLQSDESAATALATALATETTNRTNADTTEATARAAADALLAPKTTTTIDLIDRTNNTTETVPAGFTTNCSTAGVTKTAPSLAGSVGTPPLRWAVRNGSTGTITLSYPDTTGTVQSLTMLAGEVLTFRQKNTSGWAAESGNKTLASLDGRFEGFGTNSWLIARTLGQEFVLISATRDSNGAITTASVQWPDGTSGTFTTDTKSTAFPGAIDAYHVTYAGTGGTKTVTQTAVTRDVTTGAVTAQPVPTVA